MNAHNMDFNNDKPDIREPIPAGTPLLLRMTYAPGGAGPNGALTKSKPSTDNPSPDVEYLKSEFTVLRGPYKGRKFWGNLTMVGGKVDEKGTSIAAGISRKSIRLMLDSAQGLSSKDESPEAAAKRVLPNGYASLQGIIFRAKANVEPARGNYAAKNGLGQVLTIDMKDYPTDAVLDKPVAPGPIGATNAAPAPTWGIPAAKPPQSAKAGPPLASNPVGFEGTFTAQAEAINPVSLTQVRDDGVPAWAMN